MKRAGAVLLLLVLAGFPAGDVSTQVPPLVVHRTTLYSPLVIGSSNEALIHCNLLNVGRGTLFATFQFCEWNAGCFHPGDCAPLAPGRACSVSVDAVNRLFYCRIDLVSARQIDARASIQGFRSAEAR